MPTFRQDEKLGTKVPLIKTADINDKSITKEKLDEGSVTNSKLAPESVTQDKFDKELLQIFKAAAGLPENLIETIQNVDTTLADHQRQISSNDDDISDLQTKTKQIKDTVDGIAVSGGASVGSAVTYDNTQSGLDAQNIQNAIDELVNNLGHYETNEEWLRVYTDTEDKFLWGIRVDGSIDWAVGIPKPIQKALNEIIANNETFQQTLTDAMEAYKATIDEKVAAIDEKKVDKEEGKSLIEDEVKECFRVIENEEFIKAIVDSEDKVLFGFNRATGKPYYPLNEMYHVEQNEEFFAVWFDAANHVLLGIRRDGEIIGEIHAVNALKQVISQLQADLASLQERVGTIDSNLKELLDVFSLQDNPEYMAVETDAEGKVLSATNSNGSHYSHNLKSETIDAKVDKEEGKSLIDSDVAESNSTIEDPEGRTEITTDAEGKVLAYRDKEGRLNERKEIVFSKEGLAKFAKSLKGAGIDIIDWSNNDFVEIPKPTTCVLINITTPKQAETKSDNIECFMEFWDKNGNYFKKPVILNAQGSSSMGYNIKNQSVEVTDGSKIKIGEWLPMDSFHIKKYFIDCFRGQCIVGYWLGEQIYQTRNLLARRPWDYLRKGADYLKGSDGDFSNDFIDGALGHPDGFACKVFFNGRNCGIYAFNLKKDRNNYHCNKKVQNNIILDGILGETFFTANGDLTKEGLNGASHIWDNFEIRNPKISEDINGNKYDGDNPKEPSENYKEAKDYIKNLTKAIPSIISASTDDEKKRIFESVFNLDFLIDYDLHGQVLYNYDGYEKNWIWCCWDGKLWTPTFYDLDSIFGSYVQGLYCVDGTNTILGEKEVPTKYLHLLYKDRMCKRYKELRDAKIFDVNNIINLLTKWLSQCGYSNLKEDITEIITTDAVDNEGQVHKNVPYTPSYRNGNWTYPEYPTTSGWFNSVSRVEKWLEKRLEYLDEYFNYSA